MGDHRIPAISFVAKERQEPDARGLGWASIVVCDINAPSSPSAARTFPPKRRCFSTRPATPPTNSLFHIGHHRSHNPYAHPSAEILTINGTNRDDAVPMPAVRLACHVALADEAIERERCVSTASIRLAVCVMVLISLLLSPFPALAQWDFLMLSLTAP